MRKTTTVDSTAPAPIWKGSSCSSRSSTPRPPSSALAATVFQSWPIYRCIVYQVEHDGHLYVLSTGNWYCIDVDYRNELYAEVEALPRFEGLPVAQSGTDEDTYNAQASAALDALCLDKKLVYDAGPDKMENWGG